MAEKFTYKEAIESTTKLKPGPDANAISLTIGDYFERIKKSCTELTKEDIDKAKSTAQTLTDWFRVTGQSDALTKINFMARVLEAETLFIERGGKYAINRKDLVWAAKEIDEEGAKNLLLSTLAKFQRVIPGPVVAEMLKYKDIFDDFFILCTDYTDDHAMRNEEEEKRREIEKDPILFGVIYPHTEEEKALIGDAYERLYFIDDWIDEYCDLTLESLTRDYGVQKLPVKAMNNFVEQVNKLLPDENPLDKAQRIANIKIDEFYSGKTNKK